MHTPFIFYVGKEAFLAMIGKVTIPESPMVEMDDIGTNASQKLGASHKEKTET